jgi:hypothetical protein
MDMDMDMGMTAGATGAPVPTTQVGQVKGSGPSQMDSGCAGMGAGVDAKSSDVGGAGGGAVKGVAQLTAGGPANSALAAQLAALTALLEKLVARLGGGATGGANGGPTQSPTQGKGGKPGAPPFDPAMLPDDAIAGAYGGGPTDGLLDGFATNTVGGMTGPVPAIATWPAPKGAPSDFLPKAHIAGAWGPDQFIVPDQYMPDPTQVWQTTSPKDGGSFVPTTIAIGEFNPAIPTTVPDIADVPPPVDVDVDGQPLVDGE